MRKIVLLILFFSFCLFPLCADEIESDDSIALGMGYCMGEITLGYGSGNIGVIGLQYQQWFGRHGVMVTAGLDGVFADYQYCIFSASFTERLDTRFYAWISGGAAFFNDYNFYSSSSYSGVDAIFAVGIGTEFIWWKHLSVPAQYGYIARFTDNFHLGFFYSSGVRYRF
ncbi:MAG: hypothetical protein K5930_12845 [Treponemataceae bacterium]|nr:hypothetical protein [Treponemataceae bacterium]